MKKAHAMENRTNRNSFHIESIFRSFLILHWRIHFHVARRTHAMLYDDRGIVFEALHSWRAYSLAAPSSSEAYDYKTVESFCRVSTSYRQRYRIVEPSCRFCVHGRSTCKSVFSFPRHVSKLYVPKAYICMHTHIHTHVKRTYIHTYTCHK